MGHSVRVAAWVANHATQATVAILTANAPIALQQAACRGLPEMVLTARAVTMVSPEPRTSRPATCGAGRCQMIPATLIKDHSAVAWVENDLTGGCITGWVR